MKHENARIFRRDFSPQVEQLELLLLRWHATWSVKDDVEPELRETPWTSQHFPPPPTSPEVRWRLPGTSLTVDFKGNPGVPQKFPPPSQASRKFPGPPQKSVRYLGNTLWWLTKNSFENRGCLSYIYQCSHNSPQPPKSRAPCIFHEQWWQNMPWESCKVILRNAFAPYRGQNPQNREKRVSESKNPISHHLRKGCSESKNPHFYTEHYKENGDFRLGTPFSGVLRNGGFFTPKPSFPDFGDSGPCKGQTRSSSYALNPPPQFKKITYMFSDFRPNQKRSFSVATPAADPRAEKIFDFLCLVRAEKNF